MRSKRFVALHVSVVFLVAASAAFAHHGTSGYDMEKVVTLKGTVTSFNWTNPHCVVLMDVKDGQGEVKNWIIELGAPTILSRMGWSRDSLKPGDEVVAETHPAKNGATNGLSGASTTLLKFVVNGHPLAFR